MLFTPKKKTDSLNIGAKVLKKELKTRFVLGNALAEMERQLGEYDDGHCIQFATSGNWSMHELIVYYAQLLGQCDLYFSTWTISEAPARVLFNLHTQGLLRHIHSLFDYRVNERKAEGYHLIAKASTTTALSKCHAKVTVLQAVDNSKAVSIVSSQNMSKNPRIEAGTIIHSVECAAMHIDWVTTEIQRANDKAR